jgi:hypothetical protein
LSNRTISDDVVRVVAVTARSWPDTDKRLWHLVRQTGPIYRVATPAPVSTATNGLLRDISQEDMQPDTAVLAYSGQGSLEHAHDP